MNSLTVSKKLHVAFYALIGLLVISIAVNAYHNTVIRKNVDDTMANAVVQMQLAENIRFAIAMQNTYTNQLVLADTPENKGLLTKYQHMLQENVEQLQAMALQPNMVDAIANIQQLTDTFNDEKQQLLAYVHRGNDIEAVSFIEQVLQPLNNDVLLAADAMITLQQQSVAAATNETNKAIAFSQLTAILILMISVVVAIGAIRFIRQRITAPLAHVVQVGQAFSRGDLSQPIVVDARNDEFTELLHVLQTMQHELRTLVQNIEDNSVHVQTVAEELLASSEEVTATAEHVTVQTDAAAAITTKTAQYAAAGATAAMEMTSHITDVFQQTEALKQSSTKTADTTYEGTVSIAEAKQQMAHMAKTMTHMRTLAAELTQKTIDISHMTAIINDMTEQTNLLALNASIEAARAGEHGKGFAVVAEEVRKLAEQSKQSAANVVQLTEAIQNETTRVEQAIASSAATSANGVEKMEHAAQSFLHIETAMASMVQAIDFVASTTNALQQQAAQVDHVMTHIVNDTTENAQSVDTIAGAMNEQLETTTQVARVAQQLVQRADELQQGTKRFTI